MTYKNFQIYQYHQALLAFNNIDVKMPVRISFYLQKNIQLIQQAVEEINNARLALGERFGTLSEDGTGYDIPAENLVEANHELSDLFNLTQDLNIHIFKLSDFEGIELSYQQMSAIMFMIEE